MKMSPAETKSGRFLRSLTPAEELACWLASRGHCLLDTGQAREARIASSRPAGVPSGELLGHNNASAALAHEGHLGLGQPVDAQGVSAPVM